MAKQSIARKAIKDVAIVAVGVLIFWFGLQLVFGTANPFYVVSSGSMVPELNVYDILVVQANDPFESVRLGDIIVFDRPSGSERVIVHRVVSIIDEDPYTLRTKGDANPASIPGTGLSDNRRRVPRHGVIRYPAGRVCYPDICTADKLRPDCSGSGLADTQDF